MADSNGGSRGGTVLIAFGLVAVVGSLAFGVWFLGGLGGSEYSHTLNPADDHHCSAPGPAAELYRHGDLSPAGQDVIARALADPGTTVRTDEPVTAFEYGTDLNPPGPQYVRSDGECWELDARQPVVGEQDPIVRGSVIAVIGVVAVLGMVTAAVGTVKRD